MPQPFSLFFSFPNFYIAMFYSLLLLLFVSSPSPSHPLLLRWPLKHEWKGKRKTEKKKKKKKKKWRNRRWSHFGMQQERERERNLFTFPWAIRLFPQLLLFFLFLLLLLPPPSFPPLFPPYISKSLEFSTFSFSFSSSSCFLHEIAR